MPKITITLKADADYEKMDGSVKPLFEKHLAKLETLPPRKFLKGSCLAVEKVGQGRVVCEVRGDEVTIKHMFATHKQYERWFKGGMVD